MFENIIVGDRVIVVKEGRLTPEQRQTGLIDMVESAIEVAELHL